MRKAPELLHGIVVFGSKQFRCAISKAVGVLRELESYSERIGPNVSQIRQVYWSMYSHPAWMRVSLDRPTIDVRTRALKWGRDRLALLLAHEACHNELYRELVVKHGVAAWRELQLNNPGLHELECIKFEMEICEELSISSEYANDLRTLHSLIPDPSLPKTNRLQFVAAVDKLRTI